MTTEGKYNKPWISWIIHWTLGASLSAHWNSLWTSQNRGWVGVLFHHPLDGTLFKFWNTVKSSPGSVGSWTQRLSDCWRRVRGVHNLPFCHPHTLKPSTTLVQQLAVRICTSASSEPHGAADLEIHGPEGSRHSVVRRCLQWASGVCSEAEDVGISCSVQFEWSHYVWPSLTVRN